MNIDAQAQERRRSASALTAVVAMHVLFGVLWFSIWFVWSFLTSFAGDAVWVFLLATASWLAAVPVTVWLWRRGSRWYGLVPVVWFVLFLVATDWGRPSEFYFPS